MPPLNLAYTIRGRPIKPVSLVLMFSMIVIMFTAVYDVGILKDSSWGDLIGVIAAITAVISFWAWFKNSQRLAEYALLAAFFMWGFRFWGIILINGWHSFALEGWYLSLCWMVLAGGSWLLERSDPNAIVKNRGGKWTRP